MSDKKEGLYQKYYVERTDGSSAVGGKHERCPNFVLDVVHDPHARVALRAYAESCAEEYPALATDLQSLLEMYPDTTVKRITINGVGIITNKTIISYEYIKETSGEPGILSVTYSGSSGEGSLSPDKSTDCVDGMIINAFNTGSA